MRNWHHNSNIARPHSEQPHLPLTLPWIGSDLILHHTLQADLVNIPDDSTSHPDTSDSLAGAPTTPEVIYERRLEWSLIKLCSFVFPQKLFFSFSSFIMDLLQWNVSGFLTWLCNIHVLIQYYNAAILFIFVSSMACMLLQPTPMAVITARGLVVEWFFINGCKCSTSFNLTVLYKWLSPITGLVPGPCTGPWPYLHKYWFGVCHCYALLLLAHGCWMLHQTPVGIASMVHM
jgi:hypothetical protein